MSVVEEGVLAEQGAGLGPTAPALTGPVFSAASKSDARSRAWLVYLAVGAFLVVGYLALQSPAALHLVWYDLAGVLAVAGMLVGIWWVRPPRILPWVLLALGQGLFVAGDVAWDVSEQILVTSPSAPVADLLYLAGYPVIAAGLIMLLHGLGPGGTFARIADAAEIAIGLAAATWVFFIEPTILSSEQELADQVIAAAYPLMDVILLSGLVVLAFHPRARVPSLVLLAIGLSLNLAGDLVYQLETAAGTYVSGESLDAVWLVSYFAIGAAALHPSLRVLGRGPALQSANLLSAPVWVIAGAAMLLPGSVAVQAASGRPVNAVLLAGGSLALFGLVALRFSQTLAEALSARGHATALIDAAPLAVIDCDAGGIVRSWNPKAEHIFGWTAGEAIGHPMPIIPPGSRALSSWPEVLATGALTAARIFPAVRRDGSEIQISVSMSPVFDLQGRPVGVIGMLDDVTEQAARGRVQARLAAAVEQTGEAVAIIDRKYRVQYANPALHALVGLEPGHALGLDARALAGSLVDRRSFRSLLAHVLKGGGWSGSLSIRRPDGSTAVAEALVASVQDPSGASVEYVFLARDVTRQRATEAELERMARERQAVSDALSHLDARGSIEQIAQGVSAELVRLSGIDHSGIMLFDQYERAVPVAMVEPAGFPVRAGRALPLARSRHLLRRATGGPWIEEVAPHPEWGAYYQRMQEAGVRAFAYVPLKRDGQPFAVLVAGTNRAEGAAVLANAMSALVELAAIAAALLEPKLQGRDVFREGRVAIRTVIDEGAFWPVFQPIVELASRSVVGHEALTRFADGTRPDRRFADAAAVGLGNELEAACMVAAVEQSSGLAEGTWLSINVSPSLIVDAKFPTRLSATGRPIILELTEHSSIDDYGALRAALGRVDGAVRLAVDDAGAGFSSMRHILELKPDFVKLDIAIVRSIDTDLAKQALVAGMRHFVEQTGAVLIGEGIETEAEARTLRSLGVDLAQGYLFGRPARLDAAVEAGPPSRSGGRLRAGRTSRRPSAAAVTT